MCVFMRACNCVCTYKCIHLSMHVWCMCDACMHMYATIRVCMVYICDVCMLMPECLPYLYVTNVRNALHFARRMGCMFACGGTCRGTDTHIETSWPTYSCVRNMCTDNHTCQDMDNYPLMHMTVACVYCGLSLSTFVCASEKTCMQHVHRQCSRT